MSHNPQCQCRAIAIRIAVLDKLLTKNSQQAEPKNEAVEVYTKAFIEEVKKVCPKAKNKNIALAAAYIAAGHDNMAKIITTIVQGTEQDCSWIKEQSDNTEEAKQAEQNKATEEKPIPTKDFKQVNELFPKIFEKIAADTGYKVSIVHMVKNKEE